MKQVAIVTGASSGIGLEVSRTLLKMGYEVFGFGRNFEKTERELCKPMKNSGIEPDTVGKFHPIVCDLLDTAALCTKVKQIAAQQEIHVLVNNAGVAYYGLHEELNPKKIAEMVRINLEVPMVLTQQLLRILKKNKGHIIQISSVTATSSNPHGCAYGATKAGLLSFSKSLFDEARKYGVKVTTICPDMTETNLYRNADFTTAEEVEAHLMPEDVARTVEFILSQREGMLVSELTLKPQLHRIKRKQVE